MWIARDIASLREHRKACNGRVVLVPTMGALHAGHRSLMKLAREHGQTVIASIFVNPTQFGPNEDFSRYPRPVEKDLQACRDEGVDGVFSPTPDVMYPQGVLPAQVVVPALAADLEGAHRPGHFAGVCRVVAKLFNITQPHAAVFGRKDLQQLLIIQAMVADLNMGIDIIAGDTLREADGLAMSSRNVYLSEDERRHATGIHKAMLEARYMARELGQTDPAAVEAAMKQIIRAHHMQVLYAVLRHARTLAPLECIEPDADDGVAAIVAAKMGSVRLIDNMKL